MDVLNSPPFANSFGRWFEKSSRTAIIHTRTPMHIFKPISHPFLHPSHPFLSLLSTLFRAYPTDPDQCGNEDQIMVADRSRFIELFEKMTSSAREQKEVAEEFRSLTKRITTHLALEQGTNFANVDPFCQKTRQLCDIFGEFQ